MLSLASSIELLLFTLSITYHKLALLRLEVIAFNPGVVRPLSELLFKVCDGVHLVKILENFRLYLHFANLPLSNPQEPLLVVIAFQKLHTDKRVARGRRQLEVLPG